MGRPTVRTFCTVFKAARRRAARAADQGVLPPGGQSPMPGDRPTPVGWRGSQGVRAQHG